MLRGGCRRRDEAILTRYPLTELAIAALLAATVVILGTDDWAELALGLTFCSMLGIVTVTDLERRVIPNVVLLAGAVVALAMLAATDRSGLDTRTIAATAAGGFLFLVALAYPGGMGMGDVKLTVVMGLYLGRAVAPALLIGFAAGALVGVAMMARHGAEARKQAVPFGPFLALGGAVALWYGNAIIDWYLHAFAQG
jgi:leader peptidase (prepilin peptidase) / N-methyltransferase